MDAAIQPLHAPNFFGGSIRRVIVDEENRFIAGGFPHPADQHLYVFAFVVGWDYEHSGTSRAHGPALKLQCSHRTSMAATISPVIAD
jgi:hypothetical protein